MEFIEIAIGFNGGRSEKEKNIYNDETNKK